MPYYHVHIDRDGEEVEETDFSKERLLKHIVEPYNQNRKFMCKGAIIYPTDIATIRIIETEQSSSEVIPKMKMEKGLMGLLSNDFALLEEAGEDVTGEFLEIEAKGRKRTMPRKLSTHISKNVFIVHGRDHKPMRELKTMLLGFGLTPIVLHEQPSGSRTIVEKLEKHSNVGYAFVILTPDDIGVSFQELFEKTAKSSYEDEALIAAKRILEQSRGSIERFVEFNRKFMQDPADSSKFMELLASRARQNVVLEFGYFIGKLGRDKVCCLHKGEVELPSDMHGIVYIPFKESVTECRDKIVKELKAIGYRIREKGAATKLRSGEMKWKDA